jgi:repressor LexA
VTYDDLDPFEQLNAASLPERQQRILVAIRDWVVKHGYSPTTRQIGEAVGLRSPSTVSKHLTSLEEKGFLSRSQSMFRPIDVRMFLQDNQPQAPAEDSVSVPVVGDIAAGAPISAIEHLDDSLTLPRELTGRGTIFALRVRGDSMIDAAICDGDMVVIRQQTEARQARLTRSPPLQRVLGFEGDVGCGPGRVVGPEQQPLVSAWPTRTTSGPNSDEAPMWSAWWCE